MIGQDNHPGRGTLDLQPRKDFQILVGREALTQQDKNGLASGKGRNVGCRINNIIRQGKWRAGTNAPETEVQNGVAADQQGDDGRKGAMGDQLRLHPDDDIVPHNPTSPRPLWPMTEYCIRNWPDGSPRTWQ